MKKMGGTNKEPFVGLAAGFSPAGVSCEATRGKAPYYLVKQ